MRLFKEYFNTYYEPSELDTQLYDASNKFDNVYHYEYYVENYSDSKPAEVLHPEILTSNLQEVLDLHRSPHDYLLLLSVVKNINDINQLKRLDCWLGYFLQNWENKPSQFNLLITTLLNQYCINSYIHSQTTLEFEISKNWLSDYFKSGIDFHEECVANYLLTMSLIIGSNPGIINKSSQETFREYQNKRLTSLNIADFFNSIFTKFPLPTFLINQLLHFDFNELQLIIELLYGKNLRNCNNLPLPISKKESQIIRIQIKDEFIIETNRIKSYLVLAKLISAADNYNRVAIHHLTLSATFSKNLSVFIKDLSYWKQVYKFAVQINRELTEEVRVEEFYEFFEKKKFELNQSFNFKGRTIKSIMREIVGTREKVMLNKEMKYKWKRKYKTKTFTDENNIKYIFKELRTGKQLYNEGLVMKHCVFTYYSYLCNLGTHSIVSMSRKEKGITKKLITIALSENKLMEARGKSNRVANDKERLILIKWFKKMNIDHKKAWW